MKGITLLESLISIAILVVIASFLTLAFLDFRENSLLSESHSIILGLLRDARSRTLSSEANAQYGVHFENGAVALFKGSAYNPSDPSNEPYVLPSSLRISSINLGGPSDVLFARLAGTSSAFGTITLESKNDASNTRVITIFATGNIQ